jgi:predicted trehalose synthase
MALDIYYREDVARVLGSLDVASGGSVQVVNDEVERAAREKKPLDADRLSERLRVYRKGYQDALAAVAMAFGVLPRNWSVSKEPDTLPALAELEPPPWDG